MLLSAGDRLGPYEVVAAIGAGGMGEVYRARDSRLDRDVAIKILPGHLSKQPRAASRFEREIKAVAALSHPNIVAIFDVGTALDVTYAVTELLEGETLRAHLRRGAMTWRKAAEIAAGLADGLGAAHSKGIVHRDLKPENVFLTTDGRVKILDFGIARFRPAEPLSDEAVTREDTEAGTILGTVGYMSPEQVCAAPVEPASDLFSLGCVLYETLCGQRAFQGRTPAETMSAILRDAPADLAELGIQIPAELERLITGCLEKNPSDRLQSARDLASDLRAMLTGSAVLDAAPSAFGKALHSIAVLPFVNTAGEAEAEYLSDGITESIINRLAQIAQLRVIPRSTIFRYKGKDTDPQTVGRDLKTRVVLTGRVIQRGDGLLIGAELIDVAQGSQLWGERYNRKITEILTLEEEIATRISESLRMKLTGEQRKRLAKRFTGDSEAYQLYLKGRYHWLQRTPEGIRKGIEHFQQAIEKDPAYALAHSGLADCYGILSLYSAIPSKVGFAKAKAAAAAAVGLDPDLAEGHTSLAFVLGSGDWDWVAAEKGFQRAIELNPAYWVAPYYYGLALTHWGRYEEAERQIRNAQDLEPLSAIIMHAAAWHAIATRRYPKAISHCLKGLEIDTNFPLLRYWLGLAYQGELRYDEAIQELERTVQLFERSSFSVGFLANALAASGNHEAALKLLEELLDAAVHRHVDAYPVALIYAGLGDPDRALEWLEKACDAHSGLLTFHVMGDPRLDQLRAVPRFRRILERMGLEHYETATMGRT
jgi:serine/threonine-protein kinase